MSTSALTERDVFRLYKANSPFSGELCFADYLNQRLRDGKELELPWIGAASTLDALVARNHLQEPRTLFRATIDAFVSPYLAQSELLYPAYMSTSTDELAVRRHFATSFREIPAALLKIECAPGLPFLDMETEQGFGGHEQEILLPRGSRFEVLSVVEEHDRTKILKVIPPIYAGSYSSLKTYTLRYKH